MIIKLIGEEKTLSVADDVDLARVVRLFNNSGNTVLITRRDEINNTIGSCTLDNNEIVILEKNPTDTIESSANVLASSIAYSTS
jgi:hypothetical protein